MTKTVPAALAAALIAATALATPAKAGDAAHAMAVAVRIFAAVDTDKDGTMTREEYRTGGLGRYGATFDTFDLDKDDSVTQAEYLEVFASFHSAPSGDAI